MTITRWKGGAKAVAQVTGYLFAGTWEATDVINLTVGAKTLPVVAGSTVIATIIDTIVTAWNALDADTYPEFSRITASRSTATLMLTGDDAGVPFSCTVATTETGGGAADAQTIDGAASSTGTDSTAATGPNFASEAKNYSAGAAPTTGDTDWFDASDVDVRYGLSQSGVTLAALYFPASFTADVGLPEWNTDGGTSYPEYRPQYLAIGATACVIGAGEGQGSQRIKLDNGSVQTALTVRSTGSSADTGIPALLWKGTHASNAVDVIAGSVGVAFYGGEVATIATLRVGFKDSIESDSQVVCGAGLTLTTLSMSGGTVDLNAGLTTVSKTAGTLTIWAGAVTTLTDEDGVTKYNSTGTITTLTVGTGAKIDFSGDTRPVTVTNCTLRAGSEIYDPKGRVTFTNPIQLQGCTLAEVKLDFGPNRTLAIG